MNLEDAVRRAGWGGLVINRDTLSQYQLPVIRASQDDVPTFRVSQLMYPPASGWTYVTAEELATGGRPRRLMYLED
jgi:hypothetical protein